jgi:purine-binding chemotaxis protein CheW
MRCAVPAAPIVEVVRAVAFRPIPGQPRFIAGAIDFHGTAVPLLDLHVRFGGAARPPALSHRYIVVRVRERLAALWVDEVVDVASGAGEFVSGGLLGGDRSLIGVAATSEGLLAIHDLEGFISECEADAFAAAAGAFV